MYIKKWKYRDGQYEFHKGINIVYGNNIYDFDTIALTLCSMCEHKYNAYNNSFTDYFSYGHHDERLQCEFVYKDKQYSFFPMFCDGVFAQDQMMEQKNYKSFFNVLEKPTFLYIRSNFRSSVEAIIKYENYNKYKKTSVSNFYSDIVKNNFILEQKFWGNMFVKNYFEPTNYTQYHCSKLCEIINEMISINNYYDFDFLLKNNCFVIYKSGYPQIINNVREKDINLQIATIMNLYMMFLNKCDGESLNDISEDDGIVLLNLEFGERPSYSDKKWKYYDVFLKYFSNMQFIVL